MDRAQMAEVVIRHHLTWADGEATCACGWNDLTPLFGYHLLRQLFELEDEPAAPRFGVRMTDDRQPTFGLRPPVQVEALPADHPRVQEQVERIARGSTPVREYVDGKFQPWIDADRKPYETDLRGNRPPCRPSPDPARPPHSL